MIDDRSRQRTAQSTGAVDASLGEAAVGGPVVCHNLVTGGVVGLDKHDAGGLTAATLTATRLTMAWLSTMTWLSTMSVTQAST